MHSIVYDVHGGFEDWAYAASWDNKNVSKQTNPKKTRDSRRI